MSRSIKVIEHSDDYDQYYSFIEFVLQHHGIDGQKHGRRRWQYEDGSLTPEGYIHYGVNKPGNKKSENPEKKKSSKDTSEKIEKRENKPSKLKKEVDLSGEDELIIRKGSKTYRTSGEKDDESKNNTRLYTNTNTDEKNQYIQEITDYHHQLGFESFAKEYEIIKDIKVPSLLFQEDLEKSLLNDKEINEELKNWLTNKAMNKKAAKDFFTNYSQKREKVKNFIKTFSMKKANELTAETDKKRLMYLRNAFGDRDNIKINTKFENELKKSGYDAYRDTYDRYSDNKNHSLVIFDSSGKVKQTKSKAITKNEYVKQYIDNYIKNYLKEGTKRSDLSPEQIKNYTQMALQDWEYPDFG